MANIQKIGDVTKYDNAGQFLYLFPACNLSVNNNILDFRFYNLHRQRVAFEEIEEKYAATNAEELADYYANNGFFSIPTGSGGGGTQDVDIVADSVGLNKEVTQALVLAELQSIDAKDFSTEVTLKDVVNCLVSITEQNKKMIFLLKNISE